MDVFYEESAAAHDAKKGARRYTIVHVLSIAFLILAIVLLVIFVFSFPFGGVDPSNESAVAYQSMIGFLGAQGLMFLALWFGLFRWKSHFNVSYDYVFVSGELRISKVFNVNKRKLITRIDCAEMIQVGDIQNSSYERFRSDPSTKEIICTSNTEAAQGKFFMYILANDNGKKLYILECKEQLLENIMKFAKRTVLESDYVSQEKKKNQQQ